MAAIAATAVTVLKDDYASPNSTLARRQIKITGVTAGDTATAAALKFSKLRSATSGYNATTPAVVAVGIDPVNNQLLIGAGPSAETIYLEVTGEPSIAR